MKTIETILAALENITPAQIEIAARGFTAVEEGEFVYGVVESIATRSIWALAHEYDRQSQLYLHSLRFDPMSDTDRATLIKAIAITSALEEIARDIAWTEMRYELGAWDKNNVGIRENFQLVRSVDGPGETHGIAIPLAAIGESLGRLLRDAIRSRGGDTKPPDRKPQ